MIRFSTLVVVSSGKLYQVGTLKELKVKKKNENFYTNSVFEFSINQLQITIYIYAIFIKF